MKIGVNYKKIMSYIEDMMNNLGNTFQFLFEKVTAHSNDISSLNTRVTTLENSSGGEWVEITSNNGQEAEITQPFTEIRMLARGTNANYSVTYNYDSNIFHNSTNRNPEYFITGNPIANNYGCKFKYSVSQDGKQYISVDSCYNGANTVDSVLEVWIKTKPTGTQ